MPSSQKLHNDFFSTAAPHNKVWKGSVRNAVTFTPMSRQARNALYRRAKRFEARTRAKRGYGRGQGCARVVNGELSRVGLCVLNALLFDFLNMRTGRLDPCYQTIAYRAGVSLRSVGRAIVRLKKAGLLSWIKRCSGSMQDGRWTMEQDSNAYAIDAAWGENPLLPIGLELGQHPPMPGGLDRARELALAGAQARAIQAALESDPGDGLAASIAALGRRQSF